MLANLVIKIKIIKRSQNSWPISPYPNLKLKKFQLGIHIPLFRLKTEICMEQVLTKTANLELEISKLYLNLLTSAVSLAFPSKNSLPEATILGL
jgi:hypothetical protein